MDLALAGRRAAVAAGTAGLGFACAQALVAEGAEVVICGSDAARAEAAATRLGPNARWSVHDVTVPATAGAFVEAAAATLGGLDILVVNGPGPAPGTALGMPVEAYPEALDRSLLSVVHMCLAAVPHMQAGGWGRIVAITSLGVRQPYPHLVLSNTARSGATAFLRTLAGEVAAQGITVNSVQPGLHATDRMRKIYGDDDSPALAEALSEIPAGRLGRADDFGAIVTFLCSEQAKFVTGAQLHVDGGAYQALQ